ncbi:protoporphyrinogen/coproporphyrinogen oxidase [Cellulomonas chengniuliangii]|uniref:FAD-dependent oxidoreductase n=1 Tax=Cellulomonas chengniuliangii TaxID=2968084 RepID=A0ABY5KXI3_9CELL|nr:FAD-dependent oxidoreductase [Cellulomonas chengniuliangii]MCC2309213.1 FAD-dependent oxidoreductase [Cellulomonas chengniuliangii]UUI75211.1 FAD-dependent oxidoreductase [Cellulomonas chengniuliangii]
MPAVPGTAGEQWDAVVIGGGVSGLVAARDLAAGGLRTLVLEGRATAGGAVGRHELAGLTLDSGAESFATRGGAVAELARELGLSARVTPPEPRGAWVQLPQGAGPLPRAGVLGIPTTPWAPDVRRTVGLLGALRASADRVLPAGWGDREHDGSPVTLGALVRRRMGGRVLERLVRPVVAGVHAADPDDIAVDAVSPGLRAALADRGSLAGAVRSLRAAVPAGSAVAGFDGGLHVLVDALLADLAGRGARARTGSRAVEVRRAADVLGAAAPGTDAASAGADPTAMAPFEVVVEDAHGTTSVVRADRLVVATPAAVDLLRDVAPGLADVALDPGAEVTLVTLVLDAPALDSAPRGTGVLVSPATQGVRAKALTHATAKWAWLARAAGAGRHVVRLSYGMAGDGPAPNALADDELVAVALRDASVLLGTPLGQDQLVASARVAWSQSLPRPSVAHREAVARVRAAASTVPGLAVCGAWVAGNGLASVVPDARAAARSLSSPQ